MKRANDEKIIRQFLLEILEKDLYEPIRDIFSAMGYESRITHGHSELGKDLVATKKGLHNVVITVKKGDIEKKRWDSEIHPQLMQMMESPLNISGVEESLPRKPLLIVSGKPKLLVSQLLAHHRNYMEKHGENPIEVWDIETLTKKIHKHLLNVSLVGNDYFEDIQRLVLSISEKSFNKAEFLNFIEKHMLIEKFSVFKLSFCYVLRRSEHVNNPYAFFTFAEFALMQFWKIVYSKKDYSIAYKFDELHELYIDGLENWVESIDELLHKEYGLYDSTNHGLNEFMEYPLRVYDTLRRLSYLSLHYLVNRQEEFKQTAERIESMIRNNYSASKSPLCEFNYNDLGITLTVLHLSDRTEFAKEWLLDIADFIIVQSVTGHKLLPLGSEINDITEFLIPTPFVETDSHLLFLILEFSLIFDYEKTYHLIRPHIGTKLFLKIKVMPSTENENEIYEKDLLHSGIIRIKDIQPTWAEFKILVNKLILQNTRVYSPMKETRPLLLILVSNIFRDRYFPDVWRNLLGKKWC